MGVDFFQLLLEFVFPLRIFQRELTIAGGCGVVCLISKEQLNVEIHPLHRVIRQYTIMQSQSSRLGCSALCMMGS